MVTLAEVKNAIRNKYTWPGGYPLFLVMEGGAAVSIDAARECWRDIVAAHLDHAARGTGWRVAAVAINWEEPDLYCEHSGARIESAYAEEEAGA